MYLCDIHSHTKISPDSHAELSDMARSAVASGLREFCVTDHCDLLDLDGKPVTTFDWSASKAQYRAVKNEVGDALILRLGIELGSASYDPAAARNIIAQGGEELDFVLGSLHNWMGQEGNQDLCYTSYRDNPERARRAVSSTLDHTWTLVTQYPDCYDSLAHIVYPLRYIPAEYGLDLHPWWDRLAEIFRRVISQGKGIEFNTSAGATVDQWREVLALYHDLGGEVLTLGSDAHRPQHMAAAFSEALALIRELGFRYLCVYRRRTPLFCKIDS